MPKKIYVVDDDPDMSRVITFRLESAGFDVMEFASGPELLKNALKTPPDLFLVDIQMPEMTGYEIVEELNKHESTKGIPIIYLTGKIDLDPKASPGAERALFFIKPCDFNELVEKMHEHITAFSS